MKYLTAFLYLLGLSFAQNNFVGRSGHKAASSRMFLWDDMDSVTSSDVQYSLEDANVANLVSHLVGVAPLNSINDREGFPAGDIFRKAKANVMFTLDSPTLTSDSGRSFVVASKATDSISFLTNVVTGSTPIDHGIVGRHWIDATGYTATAYGADGESYKSNLADVLSTSFAGRSLSLAYSADTTRARVFAPHATNVGASQIATASAFPVAFTHKLTLAGFEKTATGYSFNGAELPKSREVEALIAELSVFQGLVESLSQNTLVTDDIPDSFFFAVSTISALPAELQTTATALAVATAKDIYTTCQTYYAGRVVAELLQEAAPVTIPTELQELTLKELGTSIKMEYLPQIYTSRVPGKQACNRLDNWAYNYKLKANCNNQIIFRQASTSNTSSNISTAQAADVASAFTIFVWITIFFILMALGGFYMLCGVGFDMTADSMLYRQERRHAHRD